MKIAGLLFIAGIVIVVILLRNYIPEPQKGGAPLVRDATETTYYARQFDELKDVDNVLYRETEEPPEDINNLELFHSKQTNSEPLELKSPKRVKFNFKDMKYHDEQVENKEMIKRIQPYFMSQPEIIHRADGSNYYWDWQFSKQAVSTDFAKDPERFVREHPLEYPSYVIRSRIPNKCSPVPQEQTDGWNYDNYEPAGSYPLTCTKK